MIQANDIVTGYNANYQRVTVVVTKVTPAGALPGRCEVEGTVVGARRGGRTIGVWMAEKVAPAATQPRERNIECLICKRNNIDTHNVCDACDAKYPVIKR